MRQQFFIFIEVWETFYFKLGTYLRLQIFVEIARKLELCDISGFFGDKEEFCCISLVGPSAGQRPPPSLFRLLHFCFLLPMICTQCKSSHQFLLIQYSAVYDLSNLLITRHFGSEVSHIIVGTKRVTRHTQIGADHKSLDNTNGGYLQCTEMALILSSQLIYLWILSRLSASAQLLFKYRVMK